MSSEDDTEKLSEGVCMITILHTGTRDPCIILFILYLGINIINPFARTILDLIKTIFNFAKK